MKEKYDIKNQGPQKVEAIKQTAKPKTGKVIKGKDLRTGRK